MRPGSAMGGEKDYKQLYESLRAQHGKLVKEHEKLKLPQTDHPTGNVKSSQDQLTQLASMRRKLEGLERVHLDGKREHSKVVADLKSELDHHKRTSKDQAEQIAKLKKQLETSENRLSELKKSSTSDASELKDLRYKLRVAEQNAEKLGTKQGEAAELRKTLATEKVRAERIEKELRDTKTKLERGESARKESERKLERAEREARRVKEDKESLESGSTELEVQVEQLRSMLSTVAGQYSDLWLQSVPKKQYERIRFENASLHLQVARLERKLGNAEDQVVELAHLIRQSRADKDALARECAEMQERLEWMSSFIDQVTHENPVDIGLEVPIAESLLSERQSNVQLRKEQSLLNSISFCLLERYRHSYSDVHLHHSTSQHLLNIETKEHGQTSSKLSALEATTSALRVTHDALVAKSQTLEATVTELKGELEEGNAERAELERRSRTDMTRMEGEIDRQKDIAQRTVSNMQQVKMAEEALKDEIERLSTELSEAEGYREAYTTLFEQVQSLVDRNALAEDEAKRLSKMNTEFLSHKNPQQRIVYLDRIRRELAETKQKLLVSAREHAAALEEVAALRDELYMYKSVPIDNKPRTHITRVSRVPLASRSTNSTLGTSLGRSSTGPASRKTRELSIAYEEEGEAEYEESGYDLAGYLPDRTTGTFRDLTIDELR